MQGKKLKKVEASAPKPAAGAHGGGGLQDALAQIRSGAVALRHVEQSTMLKPAREASDSLAAVLKRKMAARRGVLATQGEDEEDGGEWDD